MSMSSTSELKVIASQCIDKYESDLWDINQEIHKNPELSFKEVKAHKLLTEFFEKVGFQVDRSYALDTAFRATFAKGCEGPKTCIICEYDALPEIGHACGHNLIAEAGVGAALGIKAALEACEKNIGQLIVYGTPAEERGGGKIVMIQQGCFKDIDFAMMVHPCPYDACYTSVLCVQELIVTYRGKSSHASAFPWDGINALDAAVNAYAAISMMRQQMKPAWRVHGVIVDGGVRPNIIPFTSKMVFYVRAPNKNEMKELRSKCEGCFYAAAQATGCTVEIEYGEDEGYYYTNVIHNSNMAELYQDNARSFGIKYLTKVEQLKFPTGSTDMGNVSYVVPSIHPMYSIETKCANHTPDFTYATRTKQAHRQTLIAAKSMAMTTIDILTDPDKLQQIKAEFSAQTKSM